MLGYDTMSKKWMLVGLVSDFYSVCTKDYPTAYTPLTIPLMAWVEKIVGAGQLSRATLVK